jgi:hypothetical protein
VRRHEEEYAVEFYDEATAKKCIMTRDVVQDIKTEYGLERIGHRWRWTKR